MGQKNGDGLGALGSATPAGDIQAREEVDVLARLAIVQGRLEGDGRINPNLEDTPFSKAAHGFWLNDRMRA